MYQSSSGFIWGAQITCADFLFAKLVRKMRMANQPVEKQCGARRLNGLSRSLKKRVEQFFTIPALLTASEWSFGFNHIASDIGIGLRLDLPIGPLRLDYGYPLQRDGYNGGGRFNFNVGYQF